MRTIIHAFDVHAGKDQIREALTTIDQLAGWWTTTVSGDASQGGVIAFTFRGDFSPQMRVDEVGDDAVVWTCVGGHESWADNTFHFELNGTSPVDVRFRQEYSRELDDKAYGTYNFSWGYYLESLRLYVETGSGKPYRGGVS